MSINELADAVTRFVMLDMVENFFIISFTLVKLKHKSIMSYKLLTLVSIMSFFTINLSATNEAFGLVMERILVVALFSVVIGLFYGQYLSEMKTIVVSVAQTFIIILFFTVVIGFPFMHFISMDMETMTSSTYNLVTVSMPIRAFEFLLLYIMHRRLTNEETY